MGGTPKTAQTFLKKCYKTSKKGGNQHPKPQGRTPPFRRLSYIVARCQQKASASTLLCFLSEYLVGWCSGAPSDLLFMCLSAVALSSAARPDEFNVCVIITELVDGIILFFL